MIGQTISHYPALWIPLIGGISRLSGFRSLAGFQRAELKSPSRHSRDETSTKSGGTKSGTGKREAWYREHVVCSVHKKKRTELIFWYVTTGLPENGTKRSRIKFLVVRKSKCLLMTIRSYSSSLA